MLKHEFYIANLISSQIQGTITQEEQTQLSVWLAENPAHQKVYDEMLDDTFLGTQLGAFMKSERADVWNRIQHGLIPSVAHLSTKKTKLWPRLSLIAASLTLFMIVGIQVFRTQKTENKTVEFTKDLEPGHTGATLTLGNGKKIALSSANTGQLADEGGIKISKTSDGQLIYTVIKENEGTHSLNTLQTANSENFQVVLPDGSKVWLNAASTLRYPASFDRNGSRMVNLEGEAYFEIAKDKQHPFIVQSRNQQIRVLGTHFNINCYANEPETATTLLEGSVELSKGSQNLLLKPGEQAVDPNGNLKVRKANLESVTDWKDGDFYLNETSFKVALRKLERWYDVDFVYDNSITDDMEAGGWISRTSKLSQVLRLIAKSGQVKFKIEGRKVYVSK